MSAVECAAENSENIHIVSILAGNCCLALNLTSKLIVNPLLQIATNMQKIILIWLVTNRAEICIYYTRAQLCNTVRFCDGDNAIPECPNGFKLNQKFSFRLRMRYNASYKCYKEYKNDIIVCSVIIAY